MNRFIAVLARVLALPFLLAALTVPATAQDGGYLIRSGDTLRIEVLEDPGLNRSVLVSPDGRITLPLAGGVRAAGKTVEAVQSELSARLAPNFATAPNVYVSIERIAERVARGGGGGGVAAVPTLDIYVIGEAAKAGKLSVARGTTVLQFFAEMGGFSKFAATKRIQLRRTNPKTGEETSYTINYDAIENGSSRMGATVLMKGDVIVIPQRKLFE
ncbi:MAG: polysaccharide biosynthesis/export family protein [Rhodobacteraceae bacterium]|jgi:polysaccharide export outer membrane protein|nr:polysaccharide biosynthesis/export family protein [Paracoccaceae bacterium]